MTIPFLRRIPGLGGPALRQVVAASSQPAAQAAAGVLAQLLAELPELLLAAVFEVATCQPLATYAAEREYQPAPLAAPAGAMVRQLQANLAAQNQLDEELQEVVFTLATQLHLLRLSADGQQLLYLAVHTHDTNLALARQLTQQAAERL
ncbi:hypothetical protein HHL22_11115 [Hymenobacter sp. RP-2-7]|uniref:Roadblock/LAMTOR2 domain-containing protein n=1 Tax=Hymenobacter polaris TaxID=2682546 RepID=A0A7Y0AE79_9BACT|nr:hypothetical protein [Hymenobacter polaris]NML65756.1 hypothetical protein [Hymenobacter polaris]